MHRRLGQLGLPDDLGEREAALGFGAQQREHARRALDARDCRGSPAHPRPRRRSARHCGADGVGHDGVPLVAGVHPVRKLIAAQ